MRCPGAKLLPAERERRQAQTAADRARDWGSDAPPNLPEAEQRRHLGQAQRWAGSPPEELNNGAAKRLRSLTVTMCLPLI